MIHSSFFVLFCFCVIPAGGGKQDEGGIMVPLYVSDKRQLICSIPRILSSFQFCCHHWHIKYP